jgi:hypothetical protein
MFTQLAQKHDVPTTYCALILCIVSVTSWNSFEGLGQVHAMYGLNSDVHVQITHYMKSDPTYFHPPFCNIIIWHQCNKKRNRQTDAASWKTGSCLPQKLKRFHHSTAHARTLHITFDITLVWHFITHLFSCHCGYFMWGALNL